MSFEADVWDFGFAVAEGYDFRGDGFPDFRIGARYLDNDEVRTREYIHHGYTGLPLARIHQVAGSSSEQLGRPEGDAVGDAQVTEADVEIVMQNLGMPGSVNEGDFDGDQFVTPLDLAVGTNQLGSRLYDPTFDAAPAGVTCSPTKGCSAHLSRDGDNWYCVERFGLGCDDGDGGDDDPSCEEQLAQCENEPNVQQARQLIQDRCGDNAGSISVRCEDCSSRPGLEGYAVPICNGDERRVEVIICEGAPDICIVLAHELTHAAQACDYGLFDPEKTCDEFFEDWNNPHHRMCMELEAYQVDGECQGIQECCEFACGSAEPLWQSYCECVDCCVNNANCCQNGRNVCVDNGQDPCPAADP